MRIASLAQLCASAMVPISTKRAVRGAGASFPAPRQPLAARGRWGGSARSRTWRPGEPTMYIEFPEGRLKLRGKLTYPRNRYLSALDRRQGEEAHVQRRVRRRGRLRQRRVGRSPRRPWRRGRCPSRPASSSPRARTALRSRAPARADGPRAAVDFGRVGRRRPRPPSARAQAATAGRLLGRCRDRGTVRGAVAPERASARSTTSGVARRTTSARSMRSGDDWRPAPHSGWREGG